ncbi:hypothetical protein M413DRAFT_22016 [Hebeloma cylindrosporum]|uniref:Uncharacterized protein n=1 Tax=Hebeloma cylindrosporum TaxID=76867 RepID=A0A0C3CMI3_HEBCY|nr:hypothetical protein M413DRAFT_22016 [Hebeloma cylindrosporum h7]
MTSEDKSYLLHDLNQGIMEIVPSPERTGQKYTARFKDGCWTLHNWEESKPIAQIEIAGSGKGKEVQAPRLIDSPSALFMSGKNLNVTRYLNGINGKPVTHTLEHVADAKTNEEAFRFVNVLATEMQRVLQHPARWLLVWSSYDYVKYELRCNPNEKLARIIFTPCESLVYVYPARSSLSMTIFIEAVLLALFLSPRRQFESLPLGTKGRTLYPDAKTNHVFPAIFMNPETEIFGKILTFTVNIDPNRQVTHGYTWYDLEVCNGNQEVGCLLSGNLRVLFKKRDCLNGIPKDPSGKYNYLGTMYDAKIDERRTFGIVITAGTSSIASGTKSFSIEFREMRDAGIRTISWKAPREGLGFQMLQAGIFAVADFIANKLVKVNF